MLMMKRKTFNYEIEFIYSCPEELLNRVWEGTLVIPSKDGAGEAWPGQENQTSVSRFIFGNATSIGLRAVHVVGSRLIKTIRCAMNSSIG